MFDAYHSMMLLHALRVAWQLMADAQGSGATDL